MNSSFRSCLTVAERSQRGLEPDRWAGTLVLLYPAHVTLLVASGISTLLCTQSTCPFAAGQKVAGATGCVPSTVHFSLVPSPSPSLLLSPTGILPAGILERGLSPWLTPRDGLHHVCVAENPALCETIKASSRSHRLYFAMSSLYEPHR